MDLDEWCYNDFKYYYDSLPFRIDIYSDYNVEVSGNYQLFRIKIYFDMYDVNDTSDFSIARTGPHDKCRTQSENFIIYDRSLPKEQRIIIFYGELAPNDSMINHVRQNYPALNSQFESILNSKVKSVTPLKKKDCINENKKTPHSKSNNKKFWNRLFGIKL